MAVAITVSHFKRASNHNKCSLVGMRPVLFHISKEHQITTPIFVLMLFHSLFHISKEHQITTCSWRSTSICKLFHISKEHQITTSSGRGLQSRRLFHISKEHQITTGIGSQRTRANCFTFQKSIKSQRLHGRPSARPNCFTFQKSIKSQLPDVHLALLGTVSHFKRASNHNSQRTMPVTLSLFHISKEHQITTVSTLRLSVPNCFTFQKSIKSQQCRRYAFPCLTVSHFKRASNHN